MKTRAATHGYIKIISAIDFRHADMRAIIARAADAARQG